MTYKIGDKVRVKKWEDLESKYEVDEYGEICFDVGFATGMRKYCGKELVIRYVGMDEYLCHGNNWLWQDWMFEDVEVKSTPTLDTIVIREVIVEPMEYVLSLLEGETKNPYLYPHNIRELALARTKLQEALFWMNEAYNKQSEEEVWCGE